MLFYIQIARITFIYVKYKMKNKDITMYQKYRKLYNKNIKLLTVLQVKLALTNILSQYNKKTEQSNT